MNMNHVTLEHANLNVTDLDRSLGFYSKLLPGWIIRWDGTTSTGERWVHFGPAGDGQPAYLSLYQDRTAQPDVSEHVLRVQHLGFAHPDVISLVASLERDAIRPFDRAEDAAYRRFYFQDPDGHELEMVQKLC